MLKIVAMVLYLHALVIKVLNNNNLNRTNSHILRQVIGLLTITFGLQLVAQAPVAPRIETNIRKIDSLTLRFFESIPAHETNVQEMQYQDPGEAVFKSQMATLGSAIPFDYNSHVSLQVRYMMRYREESINRLHERMQIYFPIYEQVLDKYNMPQALKYVSIIESNLNPEAKSWCGATCLWQFMPYTGRYMGMTINYELDERKSIIRSTEKACEYFLSSYNRFGDWLLAIASYNCGAGNVQKAINRSGGKMDFWSIKPYLPKETQTYVPKFIAAAYIHNFSGFSQNTVVEQSQLLAKTLIPQDLETRFLAEFLGVDKDDIHAHSHEFLKKNMVKGNSTLLLPYDLSLRFISNADSIYSLQARVLAAEEAAKPVYERREVASHYKVRRGDNITSIARKYGVSVSDIKRQNNLKSTRLVAGKTLKVTKTTWVRVNKELTVEEVLEDEAISLDEDPATDELLEEENAEKSLDVIEAKKK